MEKNKLELHLRRSCAYRNIFDTNYKVWEIAFNVPIIGRRINTWLQKHNMSGRSYKEDTDWRNRISYVRYWYRKG